MLRLDARGAHGLLWLGAAIAALLVVGAIAAALGDNPRSVGSLGATSSQTASAGPTATARPTIRPTPRPTPQPPSGPTVYQVGDVVTVTADGSELVNITLSQVSFHSSYPGAYYSDEPAAGNVYVQVWVTYDALADGVHYSSTDWAFFNNDIASGDSTYASNGPEPTLSYGELPNGRRAEGWVIAEVPVSGRLVMSYSGLFSNDAPIFEVELRAS